MLYVRELDHEEAAPDLTPGPPRDTPLERSIMEDSTARRGNQWPA